MATPTLDIDVLLAGVESSPGRPSRVNEVLAVLDEGSATKLLAAFRDAERYSTAALLKVVNAIADANQIGRLGETTVRRFRQELNNAR